MPHVLVKLWPGNSDDQKHRLADAVTRGVSDMLGYGDEAVSVGFQQVAPSDWPFSRMRDFRRSGPSPGTGTELGGL